MACALVMVAGACNTAAAADGGAFFGPLETDARLVPWSDVTRLALGAGRFPPAYRPLSEAELHDLLAVAEGEALSGRSALFGGDDDFAALQWLVRRFHTGQAGFVGEGCTCQTHPWRWRLRGRVITGYSELGDPLPDEGGLDFVAGHNAYLETSADVVKGVGWASLAVRIGGHWAAGGTSLAGPEHEFDAMGWPGWDPATGRTAVRAARRSTGPWTGRMTRALVGARLGAWALSAGWDHRRTGPGLTGALSLDQSGEPFPALTVRRTDPFRWRGVMKPLAPSETLLRVGLLSRRAVGFHDDYGNHERLARPWFCQWLVGWQITGWFRAHFTHTVMATARSGTLWPDLLQVNLPTVGTTWRELESGPITDRVFAAQFEFRWREAPWVGLPSAAGRLFWDYGGTDFLPSGPGGLVPEISVPASVLGVEMIGPRWDLALEYAELRHPNVLWYSNDGYEEGYTHAHTLLGHPLGGSGEAWTALVRVRPRGWGLEPAVQARRADWGEAGLTPGAGRRYSLGVTVRRAPQGLVASPLLWEITGEWNREAVDPAGHGAVLPPALVAAERDWWRVIFKIGI